MSGSGSHQNFRSMAPALEPCVASLGAFLRRLHPRDTSANVAADTGIPSASIDKWLQGIAFPRARHQFALMGAYGPSVLAAMVPAAPRWLDDAVRAERLRELEANAVAAAAARDALRREIEEGRR